MEENQNHHYVKFSGSAPNKHVFLHLWRTRFVEQGLVFCHIIYLYEIKASAIWIKQI